MAEDMVQVRRPRTNQFAEEPQVRIGRSQFDRTHQRKMTFDASYLVPFYVDEVLPGDTFTCRLNGFCRVFSPLDAPIMDNIELETFAFFVPARLVWTNWVYMQGEHDDKGAQDTSYTIPILTGESSAHAAAMNTGRRLMANFGIPHDLDPDDTDINALPFRAYNLIYNTFFRDQNLIDEIDVPTGNGPDDLATYYSQKKTAKKHDYFTSCLPYLQKGDPVEVALSGLAPVTGIGKVSQNFLDSSVLVYETDQTRPTYASAVEITGGADESVYVEADSTGNYMNIYADLGSVGMDVNTLRESVALQRALELDARGGTRYVESIKSRFNVTSPDFRLQRPEYLGGGKSYINVNPVANTVDQAAASAAGGVDVFQGELKGVGAGVISGHGWAKSFTEHGYIIGLIRARGDITYFQGLDRMWSRSTRYDFYEPIFANLGEQSVLNKELFADGSADDELVFGYQERWSEYRFKKSELCGYFNPDVAGALSHWHLAEDFASLPTLNSTFIQDATPMSRVQSFATADDFLLDLVINLKCARPIPVHSIPSLVGMRF